MLETRRVDWTDLRQKVFEFLYCLHQVSSHTDWGPDRVGLNVHQKHLDCHTCINNTESAMSSQFP